MGLWPCKPPDNFRIRRGTIHIMMPLAGVIKIQSQRNQYVISGVIKIIWLRFLKSFLTSKCSHYKNNFWNQPCNLVKSRDRLHFETMVSLNPYWNNPSELGRKIRENFDSRRIVSETLTVWTKGFWLLMLVNQLVSMIAKLPLRSSSWIKH